jgi:Phage tail tube protein
VGTIARGFGIVDDAVAGGTDFDTLPVGTGGNLKTIPDATIWWPVTGGNQDATLATLSREDEVRGRRAAVSPMPFRSDPAATIPINAYRVVMEKLIKKTLGGADTVTGTAPAALVHSIAALQFGAIALPAFHMQIIRDDLNYKIAGCSINRLSMNFPLDGFGTLEFEAFGLYQEPVADPPPTPTLVGFTDPLLLRDAKAYIDPTTSPVPPAPVTGTLIPDIQGVELSWTNNLNRKPYAGRNIATRVIGTPALTRKLWYPTQNKLGAAQDVTFALVFGSTSRATELARDYGQIQKIVIDLTGPPMATTPVANELVRITIYNAMWTGGGADDLSARDDLTTRVEGGAFYSEADANDIKFEVVNNIATPIP